MTAPHDRFRALHHAERPLLLPNAWDHASGALFAARGFPALGTTSLGVAAAHGRPDGAGATRDETLALARLLVGLGPLVTVDVEHGMGEDPEEVAAFAAQLAGLGVVGVNVEDGRSDGTLAPAERHAEVVAAIAARVPGVFVNARTDTFWLGGAGASLPETVARGTRYLAAGADGVFVPGVTDPAAIATLAAELDGPLNVLLGPATPPLGRLAELGVRRASFGSLLYRAALGAALEAAVAVREGAALVSPAATPSYADVAGLAT